MTLFVICHATLPDYRPPEGSVIMWMSPAPPPETDLEVVRGYDYFDNPEHLHDKLSGCLGSMAIQRHLKAVGVSDDDRVTIWQYRKFLSETAIGDLSPNYPGMRLVGTEAARALDLPAPGAAALFTVPAALRTEGVAAQYQRSHHIVDLLRYTTLAIELGMLPQKNTMNWLNEQALVPGGIELGTYPAGWWLSVFEPIARLSLAFVERYEPSDPLDPYQKRAVAFCQERIGSQILVGRLRASAATLSTERRIGIVHTVTDELVYVGGRS